MATISSCVAPLYLEREQQAKVPGASQCCAAGSEWTLLPAEIRLAAVQHSSQAQPKMVQSRFEYIIT
ncbi:unnamed protein product [Urochloa humidicola]